MRAIIQRVTEARVIINDEVAGEIKQGFLVFLGVGTEDTESEADLLWRKISRMRIFADDAGKTNLDLNTVGGNLLIISQFTLYADCKKGNRPSFTKAASPELGNALYEYFLDLAKKEFPDVQSGEFGADMSVSLVNDGPFTILLDTAEL
ncbi:MAG TPA: D-tyrosyl-tRNA(Tyr) deacylase [Clostridiaceae bacterium]|nr:D-tyrosyl-tRNA(Tyr) deacylase [Clostridiaceae bacterium]